MARLGSIPKEGSSFEFLKEHMHCMSALEIAVQHAAEGGRGFRPLTNGLQDIRPSVVMPQMV